MASIKPSRLLILLLLPALMWQFFNTTFNRHIHVLADGYVITHSHPFEKNQAASDTAPSHKHTQKELLLLGLFCEIVFLVLAIMVVRPCLQVHLQMRKQGLRHSIPIHRNYQVHHYHAPPLSL